MLFQLETKTLKNKQQKIYYSLITAVCIGISIAIIVIPNKKLYLTDSVYPVSRFPLINIYKEIN